MSDEDPLFSAEAPPKANGHRNGVLTRYSGAGALSTAGPEASLGKIMRWLLGHEDSGSVRCFEIKLGFQTAEMAAEGRSPEHADTWTLHAELTDEGRRTRYREIAEAAWKWATEFMSSATVPHLWKLIRFNETGAQVGTSWFRLQPELGTNLAEFGADPANDKGALGAMLRHFNTGSALQHQGTSQNTRLLYELLMAERAERERISIRLEESVRAREEALNAAAERQLMIEKGRVDVKKSEQDLEARGKLYEAADAAIKGIIAKYTPVDATIHDFIGSLDQQQLQLMSKHLTPDQQQKMFVMLQRYAAQQQHEIAAKKAAEEKAKDEAEKDAKEAADKAEKEAKAAAKTKARKRP